MGHMSAMLGSQLGEDQDGILRPEFNLFDRNSGSRAG
jgi:hypothetical protein